VPAAGLRLRRLALRSLRTVELDQHAVLDPLRLALSVPQAAAMLAAERPAAIFTTGGYVAVPVLMAAAPLGIPVVLWDGNVVPGRAVRATARLADAIAVSFAATCAALASAAPGRPCYLTGTPIRDTRDVDREAARVRMGIPDGVRVLLVFGGSQAVRRFNSAVAEALPRLVERVAVIHVTGDDGYAAALTGREALPPDRRPYYRPHPFLRDDMLAALAAADLVVGRAGSSTLAEVSALGLPIVVVPYPHAAGHQRANARALVEAGAARLIDDEAFDADVLLEAATLLDDPVRHLEMATAARALGRPAAADAVAELVLAAAERRPWPTQEAIERRARGLAA
jgi:UDP-N-acetylglucosamine--N-acetylmuramyl-(pentapeptide) pyrophosphoryl-undecaprenol N-acetylglucosamine transferase